MGSPVFIMDPKHRSGCPAAAGAANDRYPFTAAPISHALRDNSGRAPGGIPWNIYACLDSTCAGRLLARVEFDQELLRAAAGHGSFSSDRRFWVALRAVWSDWTTSLAIVRPATVVAWHRRAYRAY